MAGNVLLPSTQRERPRPNAGHSRREAEAARRREAEHRRLRAEEIRERVRSLPKGKRGPRVDPQDSIQLARNLSRMLDEAEGHGVKRKAIPAAAGLGNPAEDSTKFLYQYTLPDGRTSRGLVRAPVAASLRSYQFLV